MLSDIITTEMIWEAFWGGVKPVILVLMPYIISSMAVCMVIWVIKRVIYNLRLLLGDSHRKAKKYANRVGEVVDLVSTVTDITKN